MSSSLMRCSNLNKVKYTIKTMEIILIFNDKKINGYAFIDECGHCIIIVYGESKRDLIKNYLL